MLKFEFTARCEEQSMPLAVSLEYKPGNQTQRARRLAAGQLLAELAPSEALVKSIDEELVTVTIGQSIWVIAEGRGGPDQRGKV